MTNSRELQFIERRFMPEFHDWKNSSAYSFWLLVRRASCKHAESIHSTPARAAGLLQSAERITAKLTRLIPQVKELR